MHTFNYPGAYAYAATYLVATYYRTVCFPVKADAFHKIVATYQTDDIDRSALPDHPR
jgi:hypothetical protein